MNQCKDWIVDVLCVPSSSSLNSCSGSSAIVQQLSAVVYCNHEVLSIEEIRAISRTKKENYPEPKKSSWDSCSK